MIRISLLRKGECMKPAGYLDNKWFVVALGLVITACVGAIDYITGPDYSLSVLYLIPVILAAWFGGKPSGGIVSIVAAAVWLLAELVGKKHHDHVTVLYWNDFMELLLFLIVSFIIAALKSSLEQEKLSARTDHLTGIPNRRCFYDLAALAINVNRRYEHRLTVVYVDIDNFKNVNDQLGHSAGDTLLRLVSATIRDNIRKSDIVARLGGDEFALLFPETGKEDAQIAIQKVRQSLEDVVQGGWPVTFSFGMVTFHKPPATVDELLKGADELMYRVKEEGKNMFRHEMVE